MPNKVNQTFFGDSAKSNKNEQWLEYNGHIISLNCKLWEKLDNKKFWYLVLS